MPLRATGTLFARPAPSGSGVNVPCGRRASVGSARDLLGLAWLVLLDRVRRDLHTRGRRGRRG